MLGAINIVKNSDKAKWVYSGYGKAFDGAGLCSFANDFARSDVIFGVDNSSSADNHKNNFLYWVKVLLLILTTISALQKKGLLLILKGKYNILLEFTLQLR